MGRRSVEKIREVWVEKRRVDYIECQENMLSSSDA
jgi:hypothetical protein